MNKPIHPIFYTVTVCTVAKKAPKIELTYNRAGHSIDAPGKGPKLYLVTSKKEIVYVGISRQSLAARLRYGFNANGKNGYHGYRWAKTNGRYCVHCWLFDETLDDKELETIEAEIVFLLRKDTEQWPKHQTEIHFHESTKYHRQIAARLTKVPKIGLSDRSTLGLVWKK